MDELHESYEGCDIRLTPRQEYCSNFEAVITDAAGRELARLPRAGDTAANALAQARRVVDFELALENDRTEKAEKRAALGLGPEA